MFLLFVTDELCVAQLLVVLIMCPKISVSCLYLIAGALIENTKVGKILPGIKALIDMQKKRDLSCLKTLIVFELSHELNSTVLLDSWLK